MLQKSVTTPKYANHKTRVLLKIKPYTNHWEKWRTHMHGFTLQLATVQLNLYVISYQHNHIQK